MRTLTLMIPALFAVGACGGEPKPPPAPVYSPPMPIDQPPPVPVSPPDAALPPPVVEKPAGYRCFVYSAREEASEEVTVDEQNRFMKEMQDRLVISVQPYFIGGRTPPADREPLCKQRAKDICAKGEVPLTLCRWEVREGDPGGWTDANRF